MQNAYSVSVGWDRSSDSPQLVATAPTRRGIIALADIFAACRIGHTMRGAY